MAATESACFGDDGREATPHILRDVVARLLRADARAPDFERSASSQATPFPDLFDVSLGSDICNIVNHRVAKGTVRNEGCED